MSQILPFLAHMNQTTFERAGMLRPDALPALELLNSLYPIINNVGFSNVQHTEPMLAPPTCYLAVLIIDITYPLSSCFSMTARNNFDVNTAIDDPDAVLKDRMRTHMGHIQAFAETLEKEVYDRFGVPGVKTDVELNVIRQELGARFAIVARCVTVEIWAWIQELTVRGNGQSLGLL